MSDIYFVSEAKHGKGSRVVEGKCIRISEVQERIGAEACECIVAVHALGGCDTTSSIFGHGKGSIFTKIKSSRNLHSHCMSLQSATASIEAVCAAGIQLLVAMYGGKNSDTLSDLRYTAYCTTSLSRRFQPERLPPSESAAKMHAMRVHLQAVVWETLDDTLLKPTDWGWQLDHNRLIPIQIVGEVAPENILTIIRCKCKGNCQSTLCSCRKHGLQCVSACSNCHGTDCTNVKVDFDGAYDSDSEGESTDLPEIILDDDLYFEDEEEI